MTSLGTLRKRLFGISPDETRFEQRGFQCNEPQVQAHLEAIGRTFVDGYHAGLMEGEPQRLARLLDEIPLAMRGFAYEGAAMGLALSDFFTPWSRRWQTFANGPGKVHLYMLYVGMGWAWARLPVSIPHRLERLDPLLRWLAVDGYGFHQGYFHWQKYIEGQQQPRLGGYAARAFDQGIGRSLWFVMGADVARIRSYVQSCQEVRQADLWAGVGLACTYAGGAERAAIEVLRQSSGPNLAAFAQGVAFAAKARARADNMVPHTELACWVVWGDTAAHVAQVTDNALVDLPYNNLEPAYEIWRQRVQGAFDAAREPRRYAMTGGV